ATATHAGSGRTRRARLSGALIWYVAGRPSLLQTRIMAREAKGETPDTPPPRRNRAEAVATSAAPLGSEAFARAGFRDPTLVLHWTEIAGAEVARLCQPVKLS